MAGCVADCTMCRIELRCVLEAAAYGWLCDWLYNV